MDSITTLGREALVQQEQGQNSVIIERASISPKIHKKWTPDDGQNILGRNVESRTTKRKIVVLNDYSRVSLSLLYLTRKFGRYTL